MTSGHDMSLIRHQVIRDRGVVVVDCLEMDVCGQGETIAQAYDSLWRTLDEYEAAGFTVNRLKEERRKREGRKAGGGWARNTLQHVVLLMDQVDDRGLAGGLRSICAALDPKTETLWQEARDALDTWLDWRKDSGPFTVGPAPDYVGAEELALFSVGKRLRTQEKSR